ncbi:MAG: Asp-tRNA(Asn)/Glu-tRNA(Gln) amidotransferase subunit GatB [candidate division WOR-3 bacterium]
MTNSNYQVIIGMEIHAQLKTKTKMFCRCAVSFKASPNSCVCPICLGLPGTLPTVNEQAVNLAIKAALALNCQINLQSTFARKHYFYPDLPKGYQITQYKEPLAINGYLIVDGQKIRIRRLHLEEDSGKSMHLGNESLVDFNRCGVPLIEIVTEPDITSPLQAVRYLQELRQILNYLDVSDCDMEKGHFRCEPNISLRKIGETQFGVRTELKNLNSLRNVREGLEFEINRQTQLLAANQTVNQETLYWDEHTKQAGPMRSKEESEDYRYFPEPDLPVLIITESQIEKIKHSLPMLPHERKKKLIEQYHLTPALAEIITESKELADYYEQVVKLCNHPKIIANWITTEVKAVLNEKNISIQEFPITSAQFAELINLLADEKITSKAAKDIFQIMLTSGKSALAIAQSQNLLIVKDYETLNQIIEQVISENPEIVDKYHKGKNTVLGFLVGLVIKKTQGRFNPQEITQLLKRRL